MSAGTGGRKPPSLPVDRDQLAAFIEAMFRHADEGTFASLRTFLELEEGPPPAIRAVKLNGDPAQLIEATVRQAQRAADLDKPAVFAPPISTFSNPKKAREVDLANGLALSVEIDQDADRARRRLEFLIGPATAVVASGGSWTDPQSGEIQDKLHLHWRLKEPTRTAEAHARLKQARTIATQLVGGDCTNKPIVHPIRWPGSWHRKGAPTLCRTVDLKADAEIDLHAALDILLDVQPEFRAASGAGRQGSPDDPGEDRETAELVRRVMNGEEYHGALRDLAWRYLKGGMDAGQVVITLRGLMDAAPEAARDDRWQHRRDQIPMLVRTAREKIDETSEKSEVDLERLVERVADDPGAAFEGEAVDFLAALKARDQAAYERTRTRLKKAGVRVGQLDEVVAQRAPDIGRSGGQGRPIALPEIEPWREPVDGSELLDAMVKHLHQFVVLPPHAAVGVVLWAIHAHAHDAAFHSPRLAITSPVMRCGKSSLLRWLARIVPRALPASNISAPALFRVIEAAYPTLLIDELDQTDPDKKIELVGIINSSHCRLDAQVIRVSGDQLEPRSFSTWAPMALASIGKLPPQWIDRSITVEMSRKLAGDRAQAMRLDRDQGFGVLARKCARWAQDHIGQLRGTDPRMPPGLNDRQCDNWRLMLGIAALCGEWPERARAAAIALSMPDDDADARGIQALADIRQVFAAHLDPKGEEKDFLTSEAIVTALTGMEGRPWAEYRRDGKPITKHALARLLKPFGIAPGNASDASARKGYQRASFVPLWDRYIQTADPLKAKESAEHSDFQTADENEASAVWNQPKPAASFGFSGSAVCDPPSPESEDETKVGEPPEDDWAEFNEWIKP